MTYDSTQGNFLWLPGYVPPLPGLKTTLCGIIGHRPLRGRCPINHITQASNEIYRASGTADHMTLERPVYILVLFGQRPRRGR